MSPRSSSDLPDVPETTADLSDVPETTAASAEIVAEATRLRTPDAPSQCSRRSLLKAAAIVLSGVSAAALCPLPKVDDRRSLRGVAGTFQGDDFGLPHRWRDGALSFTPERPTEVAADVVIVGGGVAGLTSAWRLQRAGFKSFLLLERSPTLGGMAKAGVVGTRRFPWGAHYVDPPGRENKGLCKLYEDLSVILGYHPIDQRPICDPAYIVKPPHRNICANGRWERGLIPWHLATPLDRRCLEAFGQDMEAWARYRDKDGRRAFTFPIDLSSQAPEVRALDQITMRAYIEQRGYLSPLVLWVVNDRCLDEFSLPIDKISAWAGIQYFASVEPLPKLPPAPGFPHDPLVESLDPTDRKMSWPEGNAFLIAKLLEKLPKERLHTSRLVVRIEQGEDAAWVTYVDTKTHKSATLKTRYVLFAAPKYMVYHCMPELRGRRDEFRDVLYVPWLVGAIQSRRAPAFTDGITLAWEQNRYRSWSQGYIHPAHANKARPAPPPDKDLREPMLLSFYACLGYQPAVERRELLQEGWDFWARLILDELGRMHPGLPAHVERLDLFRWGHAMHGPTPGFLFGGTRDAMRKPHGRVLFSQSDVAGLAVFEQTAVRGLEVAEQVMRALKYPFHSIL